MEERQRNLGPQQQPGDDESEAIVIEPRVLASTPATEQAAAITELKNEVSLLRARMMVDRLELPRMAEDKLESIQSLVIEIAELVPQVSFELYQQNPENFQRLCENIKARMAQIEIQLVTFVAAVELEYPKISFFQKLAVTLIALVRNSIGEATLMRTLSSQPAKRKALLGAVDQFRNLLTGHSQHIAGVERSISDELHRPLNQRTHELLMQNDQYQALLHETRGFESELERCIGEITSHLEISLVLKDLYTKWVGKDLPYASDQHLVNLKLKSSIKNAIESRLAHNRKLLDDYEKSARIQAEKDLHQSS